MKCPLCKGKSRVIETIATERIDDSLLYEDIIIRECQDCDHVFNELDIIYSCMNTSNYYRHEYSQNKFTPTVNDNNFLGIDFDGKKERIITQNELDLYTDSLIKFNNLTLSCNGYDIIVMDHFLEHCWDIQKVMENLKNNLNQDGLLYISVPDYKNYNSIYFLLIKEHVHHFNELTLKSFMEGHGFKTVESASTELEILNGKLKMPVLEFLFKYDKNRKKNVYCYGIGREFMYILANSLNTTNIKRCIDDTPAKIGKTVNGIEIHGSDIVKGLDSDTEIIITAIYHSHEIQAKILNMGYQGKITVIDKF